MNDVKALSHGSRACIKSLEVRNFCTKRKKASCYTREMITVLTLKSDCRMRTQGLRKNVCFPVIYLIFLTCLTECNFTEFGSFRGGLRTSRPAIAGNPRCKNKTAKSVHLTSTEL